MRPDHRPPSVDQVLGWPEIADAIAVHGRPLVLECVREQLAQLRAARIAADNGPVTNPVGGRHPDAARILAGVADALAELSASSLRPVFNLTGTVLHTSLGRAPLPREAVDAMMRVASGASSLEVDLETGKRGERDDHVAARLCRLTGAQAATVVNNNAAAVLLALNTLGLGREVIVSRGELVEIGGAFRLPDIMARAGCRLREVGTTNRTHLPDFEDAIGARTALLMKAHTSNYRIEGFTAEVPTPALAGLASAHRLPLLVDLGSGTLVDLARFGLPHEPTPAETLRAGAHLVTFSGDKLLGGPQAGLLVGDRDLIARIRRNPMKRAMRCDKLTLAALDAVLRLYENPERLPERLPVLRLLTRPAADIAALAHRLEPVLARFLGADVQVDVHPVRSQIGSGALPVDLLPSFALRIRPSARRRGSAVDHLADSFRRLPVPVIGRIAEGALLLDLRCLEDEAGFRQLFAPESERGPA